MNLASQGARELGKHPVLISLSGRRPKITGRSQSLTKSSVYKVEPFIVFFSFLLPRQKTPLTEIATSAARIIRVPVDSR